MIRNTLPRSTATVALIIAIATAASAGSTDLVKTSTQPMTPSVSSPKEEIVSRMIVKRRARADAKSAGAPQAFDAADLSKSANVPMTLIRAMSGDAHVIKLGQPVALSEARVIAERLMRNDDSVEFAEPDIRVYPTATTPSDPGYVNQWHYFAPAGANLGGANLPDAWDVTKGSASITVAVIDTGYRQHADLGTVLPGYDFIDNTMMANDGGGRDSDPQDPGDWVTVNDKWCDGGYADNSSWHGTHVAGTIAALMNNGIGGTGIAPNVRILPVRTLGKCGGYLSDVADGMRWAAGLAVPGVPANPTPAHVLNLSLGAAEPCSTSFQNAATEIVNAGKVIVAAAGNSGAIHVDEPGNCVGVFAVTAHTMSGLKPSWASVGPETMISAPGGDPGVYSLSNTGTTVPAADSYADYQGTSMATPHVAGVVALMLSVDPSLTPAQVKSYLQSSARAFPAGSYCATSGIGLCGSGLLDAAGALSAISVAPPTVVITTPYQVVAPNATVSLAGSATAHPPRTIKSYLWTQLTGATVAGINDADTANATFTSPATGTYSFQLAATDNVGLTGTATATVKVNSAPVLTPVEAQTVTAGNALDFTVGATDVDGDTPIFHSISLPTGATLSAHGEFSWSNATPTGSTTMTYYASDADGANSAQGTVYITVTAALPSDTGGGGGGGGCLSIARSGGEAPFGTSLFSLGILLLPSCALGLRRFFRRRERTVPVRHPPC